MKATVMLLLALFLLSVPLASAQPTEILEPGAAETLPTTAEAVTTGPPPGAIPLFSDDGGCPGNGGWEDGEACWYGWYDPVWGANVVDWQHPYEGTWHLKQAWTDTLVRLWQPVDLSACSPLHPVWIRRALAITTNKPPEGGIVDVTESTIWSFNWRALAFLEQLSNLDEGPYLDDWFRVEGLMQVTGGLPVYLSLSSAFSFSGMGEQTRFHYDGIEVWCPPVGYQLHRVYLPIVVSTAAR